MVLPVHTYSEHQYGGRDHTMDEERNTPDRVWCWFGKQNQNLERIGKGIEVHDMESLIWYGIMHGWKDKGTFQCRPHHIYVHTCMLWVHPAFIASYLASPSSRADGVNSHAHGGSAQLSWRRRCSAVHLLLYQVLLRLWGFRVCIHTFFCIHYTYALRVIHQEHVYFKLSCFLNLLLIFFAALYGYGALDQSWSRLVSGCYRTPSDVIDGSIRLASIWQCVSLLATMYRET